MGSVSLFGRSPCLSPALPPPSRHKPSPQPPPPKQANYPLSNLPLSQTLHPPRLHPLKISVAEWWWWWGGGGVRERRSDENKLVGLGKVGTSHIRQEYKLTYLSQPLRSCKVLIVDHWFVGNCAEFEFELNQNRVVVRII